MHFVPVFPLVVNKFELINGVYHIISYIKMLSVCTDLSRGHYRGYRDMEYACPAYLEFLSIQYLCAESLFIRI